MQNQNKVETFMLFLVFFPLKKNVFLMCGPQIVMFQMQKVLFDEFETG